MLIKDFHLTYVHVFLKVFNTFSSTAASNQLFFQPMEAFVILLQVIVILLSFVILLQVIAADGKSIEEMQAELLGLVRQAVASCSGKPLTKLWKELQE